MPAIGQPELNRFNERTVEKKPNPQDKEGIWMLDFHFKDPRLVSVNVPGKGRQNVWYLWYQVGNDTGEPRTYVPRFVWVSQDTDTVHRDKIMYKALESIQRLEDPTNLLDVKNSVTITDAPVPPSKEFNEKQERVAFPKLVTGVATWDDIDPKSTQFSIYVYGLSNGWAVVDGPDGKPIVRRKTLQLKFKRLGDDRRAGSDQIRYLGHDWIYATAELPENNPDMQKLLNEKKLPQGKDEQGSQGKDKP